MQTESVSTGTLVSVGDAEPEGPQNYINYPNPFNPSTKLIYSLPQSGHVKLEIYDIAGRRTAALVNGFQQTGEYEYIWNAANATGNRSVSGMYFARLQAGKFSKTIKLLLMQ
jgi:hypothetical protein